MREICPESGGPGRGAGWPHGRGSEGRPGCDVGWVGGWPWVAICDSAHRSPWTTRSPRTPRCPWIPGKACPTSGRGGGVVFPGKRSQVSSQPELLRKGRPGRPLRSLARVGPGEGGCDPGLTSSFSALPPTPHAGEASAPSHLRHELTETQRGQRLPRTFRSQNVHPGLSPSSPSVTCVGEGAPKPGDVAPSPSRLCLSSCVTLGGEVASLGSGRLGC